MYRVDFIDNNNYTVMHSLSLTDGLDKIKINADKIAGTTYFAKEPKRIEFECFKDACIEEFILSGDYELDRYVSQYFIRLYENNSLVFHGIIDTSFVSYNAKNDTVRFTCYDYLKLLSKFSEARMMFALMQGYHPGYCFGYMVQSVELSLGITINHIWGSGWTPLVIEKTDLDILKIEWQQLIYRFINWNGDLIIQSGFRINNLYTPEFRIIIYREHYQYGQCQCKVYAKTYRFYNHICFHQITDMDVDTRTSVYDEDDYEEMVAEREELLADYYDETEWIGVGVFMYNGKAYSFTLNPEDYPVNGIQNVTVRKAVQYNGNAIPYNMYPKGFYELGGEDTEIFSVLKAALMLHNLTLMSDQNGTIRLVNKDEISNDIITIDSADVVEFKKKRLNRPIPQVSALDCLLGDTNALKEVITEYYSEFFSQIWELNVVIDNLNKYSLSLFNQIQINGILYRITEIQRDPKADEYKIKAWEL